MNEIEAVNLKEDKERSMGGVGGRKGKGKMMSVYCNLKKYERNNLKNASQIRKLHVWHISIFSIIFSILLLLKSIF